MTEAEWLTSDDPAAMLETLQRWDIIQRNRPGSHPSLNYRRHPRLTDRVLRLFACACCRQVWHLFTDPRSRKAVEVAERYADGEATEEERESAFDEAVIPRDNSVTHHDKPRIRPWIEFCATECCLPQDKVRMEMIVEYCGVEHSAQAALLRDLVGNPWRPVQLRPVLASPDMVQRAVDIARTIYDERRWHETGILADALDDAGCDNADILNHLRGLVPCPSCHLPECEFGAGGGNYWCPACGGTQDLHRGEGWVRRSHPFVRGDWCLDTILGKN